MQGGVTPFSLCEGAGLLPLQLPTLPMLLCTGGPQDSASRNELIIAGNPAPAARGSVPSGPIGSSSESPPQLLCKLASAETKSLEVLGILKSLLIFRKTQGWGSGQGHPWLAQPPTGSLTLSGSESLCILFPHLQVFRSNSPSCYEP